VYAVKEGIAPPILNLGITWRRLVRFTLRPLYIRNRPRTHCTGGYMGPRAGLDASKKRKITCLCMESNHDPSIV